MSRREANMGQTKQKKMFIPNLSRRRLYKLQAKISGHVVSVYLSFSPKDWKELSLICLNFPSVDFVFHLWCVQYVLCE